MSTTTKSKWYLLIIGLLLITNMTMLIIFINCKQSGDKDYHRNKNFNDAMLRNFLQKEIAFTPQQLLQFDSLSQRQHQQMKADFETIKNNKTQQLKELGQCGFTDSAIAAAVTKSVAQQKLIEQQMLINLATIRKICTASQLAPFDSSFYKIFSKRKKDKQ